MNDFINFRMCTSILYVRTFFQSAHFLCIRFHFLIEQWYFGWAYIRSEWYLWRLNWYGGSLLSHSLMRLSFAIHFIIPIKSAPILLFRWTWFTVWFWIFYKKEKKNIRNNLSLCWAINLMVNWVRCRCDKYLAHSWGIVQKCDIPVL